MGYSSNPTPPVGSVSLSRNSSIELLRIFAILMIISMHLMGNWWSTENAVNREIIVLLNALFNVGSSLFILVSGYYGIKFKPHKVFHLWFMTLTYTIPIFFMNYWITGNFGDGKFILHSFFPIFTNYKWFITSYIMLSFFSPWLNKGIALMSKRKYELLLMVGGLFFVIAPTMLFVGIMADTGKGIVNMTIVYLLGRYLRLYGIPIFFRTKRVLKVFFLWMLIFVANSVFTVLQHHIAGYYAFDSSVFIIVLSILIFSIYISKDYHSKCINNIAKYCFPIYLFSDIVWLLLNNYIISIKDRPYCWFMMPLLLLAAILASIIYEMLRNLLFSRLEETAYHVVKQCVNNIIRKYSGKLN